MSKRFANTVRAAFALFMLGVGMYAGIESLVAHELYGHGLSSCGTAEQPCALQPLHVTAGRAGLASAHKLEAPTMVVRAANGAPSAHRTAMAES
ncbi:MAG: hypothetical protein JO306_04770 [Gemmatimonadetes bacterium]|nr:hypothetical protein [Gemmatimonadota bacterium]